MQNGKQDEWDTGGKKKQHSEWYMWGGDIWIRPEGQVEASVGQFQKGESQAEGTTNVLRLERIWRVLGSARRLMRLEHRQSRKYGARWKEGQIRLTLIENARSVTDFKWAGEQHDPSYSFKRSLWLLCGLWVVQEQEKRQRNGLLISSIYSGLWAHGDDWIWWTGCEGEGKREGRNASLVFGLQSSRGSSAISWDDEGGEE